ncbi:hypothetical protein PHAVU_002G253300 [Phaseolus vulgaris]|uniref:Uncharacterized protein n=1 Tax=Phaseolus vulgaris TaxID=3885 RepID=V7CQS8_PHAVU|nr:hypothetical protein PHAVU_002G253300g [Phaseolus vulgaris]ESW31620.1 hypothetical protein PHAVU_002G253300g [Phaseolus vulgaris]
MEVVFSSTFLDGGTGFWNLRATVELLCYTSRSLPRFRCRLLHQLQNPLHPLRDFFVQNSIGYLQYRNLSR